MADLVLNPEENDALKNEVEPIVTKARLLVVKTSEQRVDAVIFAKSVQEFKEKIEERFHPTGNKKKAYALYEATLETEKAFYKPLDEAISTAKEVIRVYDREEALRIRREAEEAESKRRQKEREDEEAKKAQIEAEEARILAEAMKALEEKEKAAKLKENAISEGNQRIAQIAAKEEARAAAKAEEIQAEGQQKIEALKTKAETAQEPVKFAPPPTATKKLVWKAKVINPLLACKSIGEGLLPTTLVEFKQSALNDLGKTYDGSTKVPGIQFYEDINGRI